jgi:hypothetical protein
MIDVAGQPGGVYGGTLPARIFAETWSGFRALQESPTALDPTPSSSPTFVPQQPAPTSAEPTSTRSARPRPTRSVSEEPSPSPSPSPSSSGLLPSPVAMPPADAPRQAARRERTST